MNIHEYQAKRLLAAYGLPTPRGAVAYTPDEAEDVAQQTFIQAWRRADSFEPGRDFAPWLATIARRLAIDELRRDRLRPSTALDAADPADTSLVTLPPSAEQIETVWAVRDAIESLDDSSRRIVRLQHVHGHTHAEIADQLGIPIGTVK